MNLQKDHSVPALRWMGLKSESSLITFSLPHLTPWYHNFNNTSEHMVLSIHVFQVVVSMKDDVHIAMYSDLRGIVIYQMLNVEWMDQTSFVQACAAGEVSV